MTIQRVLNIARIAGLPPFAVSSILLIDETTNLMNYPKNVNDFNHVNILEISILIVESSIFYFIVATVVLEVRFPFSVSRFSIEDCVSDNHG